MSEQERAAKKEDRVLEEQKKKKLHKSGAHPKVMGMKYPRLQDLQEK